MTFKWKGKWFGGKVEKKLENATFKTLNHAAGSVRLTAKRSIKKGKKPSAPGSPPHTQTSRLNKAIIFYVDRKRKWAIVGPSKDLIGLAGAAHERGGIFRGDAYPERPYMRPALEAITPRLPAMWAASFKK